MKHPDYAKCPCCAGADTGDFDDLCDTCAVAALEGRYPHECRRQDHTDGSAT